MTARSLLTLALPVLMFSAAASAQLKVPQGDPKPAAPARSAASRAAALASAPASAENAEMETAGKLAAAGWLTLLDRRDWGRAWETSAGMFRSTVPLSDWMDGIPKVREPLGTLIERTPADSIYKKSLEGRPAGDYVSVNFTSKFDKEQRQEIVTTVREPDGKWRVTGYSAR